MCALALVAYGAIRQHKTDAQSTLDVLLKEAGWTVQLDDADLSVQQLRELGAQRSSPLIRKGGAAGFPYWERNAGSFDECRLGLIRRDELLRMVKK